MIMVNTEDQPKTVVDESGNQCVMVGGKMQVLQQNEKGQMYYVNEDGKIQI